jgi:hypothetical protein
MRDVFDLEHTTNILADDSYIVSYPHLLGYFVTKTSLGAADVVCGAHMVYGWMPTILELYSGPTKLDLVEAADLLTGARSAGTLTDAELGKLAGLVNNSLVGASKLLHFIAPNSFAIWDSKVYSFVFNERPHNYRVNQVAKYRKYLGILRELQRDQRFGQFHISMNGKIGYTVSPLRALELVMYLNAPVFEG